ncbi:MAG: type II toxin-antitoxin system VapC family toxin [Acidobacteriaceae bacterium]
MAVDSYLLDTNVLLRWTKPCDTSYAEVSRAVIALNARGDRLHYTSQNLGEFWNVSTRSEQQNGFGLSPAEAEARVELIENEFTLVPDGSSIHRRWRRLLVEYQISGVQLHDARLAAAMFVHDVDRILTFNVRDFVRYRGIIAVHPAEV